MWPLSDLFEGSDSWLFTFILKKLCFSDKLSYWCLVRKNIAKIVMCMCSVFIIL